MQKVQTKLRANGRASRGYALALAAPRLELRSGSFALTLWVIGQACSVEAPQKAPPPAPVRVEQVASQEVPLTSEYVGTIRSRDATEIRAQVTGRITEIAVCAGQEVEAGTLLMNIDQGRQQAMVSRAQAATASAASDLERARADLAALTASRDAARARADFTRRQRERVRALFAADNASRQAYEQATTDLSRTEAELQSLSAQLDAQRAAITGLKAAVDESKSSVREGQAELSFYNVQAPIAGRLGDVPVRVGDLVVPNTLLTSLEGNSSREVYVQVPVDKRAKVRTGLTLQLVDTEDEVLGEGPIAFVSPSIDPRTQTVLVTAPLPEDCPVVPGQYVRARVVWDQAQGPTLPPAAVQRINTQPFAFVLQEGDPPTVQQRPVVLGALHGGRYLVEDGLEVGERVVTAGIQRLRNGAPVAIETQPPGTPADGRAHAAKQEAPAAAQRN